MGSGTLNYLLKLYFKNEDIPAHLSRMNVQPKMKKGSRTVSLIDIVLLSRNVSVPQTVIYTLIQTRAASVITFISLTFA